MAQGEPADEPISKAELEELLADATGTGVEDVRAQTEDVDIGALDEAEVVEE